MREKDFLEIEEEFGTFFEPVEEKFKWVVRGGKKVKKTVRTRKVRATPAQKRALVKARKTAWTPAARKKRNKSLKKRKTLIKTSADDFQDMESLVKLVESTKAD